MACCILSAYILSRLIDTYEAWPLKIRLSGSSTDGDSLKRAQAAEREDSSVSVFLLRGMTCESCKERLEEALTSAPGVTAAAVSLPLSYAQVEFLPSLTSVNAIKQATERAGYEAELVARTGVAAEGHRLQEERLAGLKAAFNRTGVLAVVLGGLQYGANSSWLQDVLRFDFQVAVFLLSAWIQLFEAGPIHHSGWSGSTGHMVLKWNMDMLISTSLILGLSVSLMNAQFDGLGRAQAYTLEGSLLVLIVLGSRVLDAMAGRRRLAGLTTFEEIRLKAAVAVRSPGKEPCPAALLRPGDQILLEPGATVPCDCFVLKSNSLVDQSVITGETELVPKGPGSQLLSGTNNVTATMSAVVTKSQDKSTLHVLADSLLVATSNKSRRSAGPADWVTAQHFVKFVFAVAFLPLLVTFVKGVPWDSEQTAAMRAAVNRTMAILAAACPCSFGLATSSTVMAGLDAAMAQGMLVTGGMEVFRRLSKLTHVAMDKTGTLTLGQISVSNMDAPAMSVETNVLLAAAERTEQNHHPIARAVFCWAFEQLDMEQRVLATRAETSNVEVRPGRGIRCEVMLWGKWRRVCVGSYQHLRQTGISVPHEVLQDASKLDIECMVYFAVDGMYTGFLLLKDTIRPEASELMRCLERRQVALTMLTGDKRQEADRVCRTLGIPYVRAECLPADKKDWVESQRARGGTVAMVGDGVNDVAALAAADVAISLSLHHRHHSHDDGVVIMSGNLKNLHRIFDISDMTVKQANASTFYAFAYNITAILLAAGVGEPWGIYITISRASMIMAASSLMMLILDIRLRARLRHV